MKAFLRRPWLLVFTLLAAGVARAETPAPARPNILFLFSDDQRFDTIAALGNAHIRTPNLDQLTREGTVFSRAYLMGGRLGAVCVSSRAMLMSGRSLFRADDHLKGQDTWPARFGQAGYTTFITGKWHNQEASVLHSFANGKSVFLGGMGNPYKLGLATISPDHKLVGQPHPEGEHSVKLFTDAAVEFIQNQANTGRPWLCYFAPNCPHDPRIAPSVYHAEYKANPPPLPPNFLPTHPFDNGEMTIRDEQLAPWPRTPEVVRQHLGDYYSYITFMDEQIGRILAALRASGQYTNTIIVFSSDNGLAVGSHGLFGKQNLYDHATHEPLIIAGPGIPRGQQRAALCYLFDVFPTLGDLTGVTGPEGNEGRSLAPVLTGRATNHRARIFTAYRTFQRAVRDERWKLIAYPLINKVQLFDLQTDPFELHDLAGNPAHATDVARLTEALRAEQAEFGDAQALTSEHPAPAEFDFSKIKRAKNATPIE